jgi:hypothetical protein
MLQEIVDNQIKRCIGKCSHERFNNTCAVYYSRTGRFYLADPEMGKETAKKFIEKS